MQQVLQSLKSIAISITKSQTIVIFIAKFSSIAKIIIKYESIAKRFAKIVAKNIATFQSITKSTVIFRAVESF